jgi:peptidoglycan-associated lipoprotein
MNRFTKLLALILIGLLATACASTHKKGAGAGVEDQSGAAGAGAGAGGALGSQPWNDPSSPLSKRVIYFKYDSSEVASEDRETVAEHARYLAGHKDLTVTLEGNTDERGSREYNIGLGERRANAVRDLMVVQGVADSQIKTVSYGEEKPAVDGHDEAAWSKNRRVEIVYPGQ